LRAPITAFLVTLPIAVNVLSTISNLYFGVIVEKNFLFSIF
jgi:hypothetical protein